jgi:CheY-like chemotaxis protein
VRLDHSARQRPLRHVGQPGLPGNQSGSGSTASNAYPTVGHDDDGRQKAAAPLPTHPGTSPPRGLRILVVDDEPSIIRMVTIMLTTQGHDVASASSGEEALACLVNADSPFNLILSDLGLGDGMNGWQLLERVRESALNTRFILSTGWGAHIDPSDVIARGGHGLLAKPYRRADLLSVIADSS